MNERSEGNPTPSDILRFASAHIRRSLHGFAKLPWGAEGDRWARITLSR